MYRTDADVEEANRVEVAWAASVRTFNLKRAVQLREEWQNHHQRMIACHESLANEHREALARLMGDGARVG